MRLRTKLLIWIQLILLLQILFTGGFTLTTFLRTARSSTRGDLARGWNRGRAYIESLKHSLYTDIFQLMFFLRDRAEAASAEELTGWLRYFISLTHADRILLLDDHGIVLVDEWARIERNTSLPPRFIDSRAFRFPRNAFVTGTDHTGETRLFLVTGTTLGGPGGERRHLYLITNIDKARAEEISGEAGTGIAFFVGQRFIASDTASFPLEAEGPAPYKTIDIGNHPYEIYCQPLSHDIAQNVRLVSLKSLLPERLSIRPVIISYLTAFLLTFAASLFLAAGMTSLTVSPFSRLNQWLHAYMDSGTVGNLDIHSRDEVGFLAGAFHGMISNLIEEKRIIGEQLDQISLLNAYNQTIMDNITAAIIVADADGAIEFCNGYFLDVTGTSFESLNGAPLPDLLGRLFRLRTAGNADADILLDRQEILEGLTLERPGREPVRFTAKIRPISLSGSRRGSLIVLEDITAAERFWQKMMIADRVTSLGILSAGMAHEINNPLGSILSHVSYLKAVERESEKLDSLSWIESETSRIAAIVSRIRAYSAPHGALEPRADVNELVRQTLEVLKFTLENQGLRTTLDLEQGLPAAACAPDELKQVILNILLNACQASSRGGAIRLATSSGPEARVRLTVEDGGIGIEAADLPSIFNPFFTTKGAKDGSGLGLSICYAIVTRAGGSIRVDSSPGKGTTVEVSLNVHEYPHRG